MEFILSPSTPLYYAQGRLSAIQESMRGAILPRIPLRCIRATPTVAIDITGIPRVVISDLARPAYGRLPRDRQAEIRRRARALAEGKEIPEQDFGGGILRFLLRDGTQVYIEVSRDEIAVRHIV